MEGIGKVIRRLRRQREWSQEQLSIQAGRYGAGLTASAISLIEKGETARPSLHSIAAIAQALDVSCDWLIQEAGIGQSEAASLSRSLSQKRSGLERWRKDYEDGLLSRSEYYQHRIRLTEEIEALTLRLQDAEQEASRLDPQQIQEAIKGVDLWAHPQEMKALLRQIGMRVVHTSGHVEISLAP